MASPAVAFFCKTTRVFLSQGGARASFIPFLATLVLYAVKILICRSEPREFTLIVVRLIRKSILTTFSIAKVILSLYQKLSLDKIFKNSDIVFL